MSRAKWKGPLIDENSLKDLRESKKNYTKITVSRSATILPKFVESIVEVYNGKKFNEINITEEMVGHKFGEFSSTRKRFAFKKKNKKNK